MTIKELEQTVGMTRSNIRFYESEGLLAPVRGANGYRDYAQADVETLEKIKLLRRLGAIALSVLILLSAFLPSNRGELTLEEFRENYNCYCDFFSYSSYRKLEEDGSAGQRTYIGSMATSPDTIYTTRRWETITEEGRTVGFRYLVEAQGWTLEKLLDQDIGVLAYVGSQAGLGFVREVDDWLNVIPDELGRENGSWEFDFVRNGYRLTQTADVTVPEGTQPQLSDSWTTLYPQGTQARVNLVFEVRRV